MRQWNAHRNKLARFEVGQEVISRVYQDDNGKLCREDSLAQAQSSDDSSAQSLGWWRWKFSKRPPTQRELNDRLEQLWGTLKDSQSDSKEALIWLVGLYLTRKKILRQESGAFVHAKSGERTPTHPESIAPAQLQAAMDELMAIIA